MQRFQSRSQFCKAAVGVLVSFMLVTMFPRFASAQIQMNGAFPPTNLTALGWSSTDTYVLNGYNFTFTFLGATSSVNQVPQNSTFTTSFSLTSSASANCSGNGGVTGMQGSVPSAPGGYVNAGPSEGGDNLTWGFTTNANAHEISSNSIAGNANGSASGNPYFVYKVTTNAPDAQYSVIFGQGVQASAIAGGYQSNANASGLGATCIATHSGNMPPGDMESFSYNGNPELTSLISPTLTTVGGVGYVSVEVNYTTSATAQGAITTQLAGNAGTSTATCLQEVRPLEVANISP